MVFTPNPGLFNQSFGGGLAIGQNIGDRSVLRKLSDLARVRGFGDPQVANEIGAGLLGIDRAGQGVAVQNIPFNREQQQLQRQDQLTQRDFQNNILQGNQDFRKLQFQAGQDQNAFNRDIATQNFDLNNRKFDETQRVNNETLDLKRAEVVADAGPDFDDEFKLGNEFRKQTQDFSKVSDAFERVKASAENPSPAGDLALIFNYMKILDPGSTVREGEFATAQNSGGVDDRIRAAYNNALNGTRLAPDQRNDFLNRAGRLFNAQAGQFLKTRKNFEGIAIANGFDVNRSLGANIPQLHQFPPPPPNPDGGVADVPPPGAAGIDANNAIPLASERDITPAMFGKFVTIRGETFEVVPNG